MTPAGPASRAAASLVRARSGLEGSAALDESDTALIGVELDVLEAQLDSLRAAFPSDVRHAIAVKTMPHPAMLRYLLDQGFGLEAASLEEVHIALGAGAAPTDVIFDSPVKTRAEIAWCHQHLAGALLNANSVAELERYPERPSFQVGLRINPEVETGAPTRYDVSGERSKFGAPVSGDRSALVGACIDAGVTALHIHIGSQVPSCDAHVEAVGRVLEVAADIDAERARAGDTRRVTTIDIGGGVRAEPEGSPLMAEYGRRLRVERPELFDTDVRTEFGQWVHANAGWAASRVETVEQRAVPMAFLHLGADLFMRDVYSGSADEFPYEIAVVRPDDSIWVTGQKDVAMHHYDLVGPLCFAGDVLARDVPLPELSDGDWLVLAGTGANTYGLWSRHCSRAVPKVVASRDGECGLWSPRQPVG